MLVSRTKPCKCKITCVLTREVCVRLIKRFIVSPTKRAVMPSHGISLRNAKLIPVRSIACYQPRSGQLDRVASDVFGRNKNGRSNRAAVIVDAGQSRESTLVCATLDEFTTYQVLKVV